MSDEEAVRSRILRHIEGRRCTSAQKQIEIFRKLYPEKNYAAD
jgi:hypothetical protein